MAGAGPEWRSTALFLAFVPSYNALGCGVLLRPCAAVYAISTLNVKNIFLAYFALAAAKANRRYPLPDPFQDSDVGKSGENSDVAKSKLKIKSCTKNRPSRPVLLPLPSSSKSTSGSPAATAPLFKTRLMRLSRAKCDCVSVSLVIAARR
jgi:hypothetical protein